MCIRDRTVARHHGTIFKLMGDGLLAEFSSVVEAMECAVSLQRGLAERNASLPKDQRVEVRIGVNFGEVIVEGDDRFGEGVNIAARLEQLAEPGGIWVSAKVVREVEKKLAFGFQPMGLQKVKNIAEPVEAYRCHDRQQGQAHAREPQPLAAASRGDRPSTGLDSHSGPGVVAILWNKARDRPRWHPDRGGFAVQEHERRHVARLF